MDVFQAMRVFTRVVDAGTFTAAAQTLGLSTAQVSRQVSELESHLQARLLQRTTRRLGLTEVGSRYLERCRHILSELEDAGAEAGGAYLMPRGRLRVHAITGLGTHLLAPLAARYSELYPEVNLELTLSQRHPDLLEEGQDVVITLARELPDSELVAQLLGTTYSVVCAAPSYLGQHGIPMTLDELSQHRCLRLLDPVFGDSWTFTDNGVERAIGDAAHAMLPHQGAGAGQGLEDAYFLARLLGDVQVSRGNLDELLAAYDALRRPRACRVQRTSWEAGELYELRDPAVGDDKQALGATLASRFDWLWNHDLDADVRDARARLGWTALSHCA
jgi:DNA-binding transcriptional LysR family regulator